MKRIKSLQNTLIKVVKTLHSAKGRTENRLFIAEGVRTIETICQTGLQPRDLFCTENMFDLDDHVIKPQDTWVVDDLIMNKISLSSCPSGLLAVFEIPRPLKELTAGLVLAQIADPGNMGTLIRSCAAMGYQTVVTIEGCDPWSPKVVQASAGTIAQVKIFELSWNELLEYKKKLKLCALVVAGGQAPNQILEDSLLVVGNEAHGLPQAWAESCDSKITLPMPGQTESLNAAVAGSIALYLGKMGLYR